MPVQIAYVHNYDRRGKLRWRAYDHRQGSVCGETVIAEDAFPLRSYEWAPDGRVPYRVSEWYGRPSGSDFPHGHRQPSGRHLVPRDAYA